MSTERVRGREWWRQAVFYQVYPLSFQDTNGDGYGDLGGVVARIDYLADVLGVDGIWLSPFYRSPMRDWGYDVSDHCAVGPMFGDITDAHRLIEEAHRKGLRVIVDYVMNHTSDAHEWFVQSRSGRDDPKRDWYVWRDGREDGPPNNWLSVFGGPAWAFDTTTGQWYRHTYLPEQPDLNWRNPEVVEAMLDVARFWMDLGVDGFRVDAAHQMMKDPEDRDNPPTPEDHPRPWKDMAEYDSFIHIYDYGHPDAHGAHRRFQEVVDSYGRDALTVGEIHLFDLAEWASYYGADLDELTMPFNFHLMASHWNPASLKATIESVLWHLPPGAWTNWTLGNHDEIRLASRIPPGHERIAALLLLSLPGTPFLYYGDELGMAETQIPSDRARDPWGFNVSYLSRDGQRTPMQWTPDPHAGFTSPTVTPWLPIGETAERVNVESELAEEGSVLNLYRRLLSLRRASPGLRNGEYVGDAESDENVLTFGRLSAEENLTIALNFAATPGALTMAQGSVIFSTHDPARADDVLDILDLGPHEGVVVSHR